MSQSDDIKARLDIVEVIREYIPVKAVGANFQALCPFHHEKTPSFVISPDKQIWHCFGCAKGGDVFAFVMEMESLGFRETLRQLAPKAGIVLREESSQSYSHRNRLLDILDLATKYFAFQLEKDPLGLSCREYLKNRGLKEETIKDWRLGYSQENSGLIAFLKTRPKLGKKYSDEEIFLAGLSLKKDDGRYYERFRGRIMFPIWDLNDNVVAFTARVNPSKEATERLGKYINSPQGELYDKSKILFGLNKAKRSLKKEDLAIIVEGQMDAISAHQAGFTNTVASSGTALSSEQLKLVKRFSSNIVLAFDMDVAGQLAAERGFKEAFSQDFNVKVIVLPQGKDPDESLRNNPHDFAIALEQAPSVAEYYFHKLKSELDLSGIEGKTKLKNKMLEFLTQVKNNVEKSHWLKVLNEEIGTREEELREELGELMDKNERSLNRQPLMTSTQKVVTNPPLDLSREEKMSELLLALALRFPDFMEYLTANLDPDYLVGNELISFYRNLIIYYNKVKVLEYRGLREYLENQIENSGALLDKIALLGEKDFYNFSPSQAKAELIKIIVSLKRSYLQEEFRKIERELKISETADDHSRVAGLMEELKTLTDKLKQLNL